MARDEMEYMRQEADANATPAFRTRWDNGHACDWLPGLFDTEEEAEAAGKEWRAEMIAMEPTRRARAAAREAYSYEVIPGWCVDGDFVVEEDR